MIQTIKTSENVLFILKGQVWTVSKQDERIENLLSLANAGDEKTFLSTLFPAQVTHRSTDGRLVLKENDATFDGKVLPSPIIEKLRAHILAEKSIEPVIAFYNRLLENPSQTSIMEAYEFLTHKGMPVTEDGMFLAYKAVRQDWFSITSGTQIPLVGEVKNGHIRNMPGDTIRLARRDVNDDRSQTCSYGLHVGTLDYVKWFAAGDSRIIICLVDPADIVSVPSDHQAQKVRVAGYTVVGEYTGPLPEVIITERGDIDSTIDEDGWDCWEEDEDDSVHLAEDLEGVLAQFRSGELQDFDNVTYYADELEDRRKDVWQRIGELHTKIYDQRVLIETLERNLVIDMRTGTQDQAQSVFGRIFSLRDSQDNLINEKLELEQLKTLLDSKSL